MLRRRLGTMLRGIAEILYVLADNPILLVALVLLLAFLKSAIS